MANIELLDNQKHKGLRVNNDDFSAEVFQVGSTMVLCSEFEKIQREYPIFFRKNPENGQFYSSAMFGFSITENLFLTEGKWQADYIPLVFAKGPFLIGFQEQEDNGKLVKKKVIYVDMDHASLSHTVGERLFDESGERTRHLDKMSNILMQINEGVDESEAMIKAFVELNLLEPVNIGIELNNGEEIKMSGLYSINDKKLNELDTTALSQLNSLGYLGKAFSVVHSMENMRYLISRKNAQIES